MNDAVRGLVEDVCKSQFWHASKFICNEDQITLACEIVVSIIDDFRSKVVNPDGKLVDDSLRMAAVSDFAKIYDQFIVSTINGHCSTTQSQVIVAVKEWFMGMDPTKYPTPAQCAKIVLCIGLQEDKQDPSLNAEGRSWLLWHADIAVPKCAGAEYYTKPQHQEGLVSSSGPVDGHVDTHVMASTESIVCIYLKICAAMSCMR